MTKHYKTPVLLIEFEGDKAFALQASGGCSCMRCMRLLCGIRCLEQGHVNRYAQPMVFDLQGPRCTLAIRTIPNAPALTPLHHAQASSEVGDDVQLHSLMSRIALLCLHFPRLRLIW